MGPADQAVLSLCDQVWQWRLSESPELATFCGFYQYDGQWDDISKEAYVRRENKVKDFLKAAEALEVSECSADVALSYRLLVCDVKTYLSGATYPSYLMPLSFLEGVHTDAGLTVSFMKFEEESDFQNLKSRLSGLPAKVSQVIDVLRTGGEQGVLSAKYSVQGVPGQLDSILSKPVVDWGLMKPFKDNEAASVPQDVLTRLKAECCDIVQSSVIPAFNRLKTFVVEEYLPKARPDAGMSSLSRGPAWYQQCLDFHLSCSMTPQQVHDLGLQEVARINAEIVKLARLEGLPDTMPELADALKTKYGDTFTCEEDVLAYVKDLCYNRIRPKITEYFRGLPDIRMNIQLVPPHQASSPAAYYLNGTPDGSRDGVYYINATNLQACLPYEMPALCLHEGEPGHHLQGVYALAADHLPDFRRYAEDSKYYLAPAKFSFNTAYVEGWGLYCEALGEEMGIYTGNLERIGRYNMEVFRAARLVVDTGLHAFGWSKEKASAYMHQFTLTEKTSAENEIDRYITWPGQACAYKVGEIKLWELRRQAETALGSKFDIKEFHHRVLSCGAVPLDVLAEVVQDYIKTS